MAQSLKRLPGMREMRVQSLGRDDSLEKRMATNANVLAARSLAGYSARGRKGQTQVKQQSTHTEPIESVARDYTNSPWLSIMGMLDASSLFGHLLD